MPGATGVITFGDRSSPRRERRTAHGARGRPAPPVLLPVGVRRGRRRRPPTNSFLVTFDLVPAASGTLLRLDGDRLPRAGLGGRRARGALPRPRHRLGLLPPPARHVRRAAGVDAMSVAVDDDLWSAVGDPTRRRMLDLLLTGGGGTATTLSEQLPVTRQAVAKHLGVLDRVGLVQVTPSGRETPLPGGRGAVRPRRRPAVIGRSRLGRPAAPDQADRRSDPAQPGRLTDTARTSPRPWRRR